MLGEIRRLYEHVAWADARLLRALEGPPAAPAGAIREYAHILGADETWLARLEGRPPGAAVWPAVVLAELPALVQSVRAGYDKHLGSLDETGLDRLVTYTHSAGQSFQNSSRDILLHVALHAQYHRGTVNWLLREAGLDPAPTDYIAYIRGAAAAITPGPASATSERGTGA